MWPIFLLQAALMAAASTIKNPESAKAKAIEDAVLVVVQQAKMMYANNPKFAGIFK